MTDERGSATIELALLAPVLLILLLFVAFLGRLTEARAEVDAAARDAARAASLMRTGESAERAAPHAAADTLTEDGEGCRGFSVAVDTSQFTAGGAVTAEVRCVVSLVGLSLLGLSGTRALVSRFVAPLDRYREISGDGGDDSPHHSSARNGGDRNR